MYAPFTNPCKVSGNGSNSLYRTDEDVIMGYFLAMSVDDANTATKMQTLQIVKTAPNVSV